MSLWYPHNEKVFRTVVVLFAASPYTVLVDDEDVLADATGGAVLLALPALATVLGLEFTFVKTDATANAITPDGSGAETINGAATYVLVNQGDAVKIVALSTGWQIVGMAAGQKNLRLPPNFVDGLNLTRISASQVRIEIGSARSGADDADITASGTITVDITVAGANGLDTGAEASNTWYYVWIIRKSSDGTTAGLLSLSSSAPTMPAGYDQKRRLGFVANDAGSNFQLFAQVGPGREKRYWWDIINTGNTRVLSGGAATVYTNVLVGGATPSLGPVPAPVTQCILSIVTNATAGTSVRPSGFTTDPNGVQAPLGGGTSAGLYCPGQIVQYKNTVGAGATTIVVLVTIDDL